MKFKVCGMKYSDNIKEVAALGPDLMGFIFYPKSKRFVGNDFDAKNLIGLPSEIKTVGVFVDANKADVLRLSIRYQFDYVQLHGNELPEDCEGLSSSLKIIKAFGLNEEFDFSVLEKYKPFCEYFLFDTKTSDYGGSGKQFDWEILKKYKGETPFFLSGGISLEDIDKVKKMKLKNLVGIDVNSKFEISPGLKDIKLLKNLKNEI